MAAEPGGGSCPAGAWKQLAACDRVLFALLLIACFFRLGELPLAEMDDITHAAMGRAILATGDWFTMHEGLQVSFLKPPLYFWLEAALFKTFSVSDFWARFPDALCGFATLLLTYRIGLLAAGRKAAFWAVLLLCSSTFFMKSARRAMLDIPVTMALCLGAWAFLRAEMENRGRWHLLAGFSLALGYYFKGVQGLYLIGIAGLFFIASGDFKRLFSPWLAGGLVLAAALIAAWAWPQYLRNGADFLYSQSGIGPVVNRGLEGTSSPFYVPFVKLFGIFIWTPLSLYGVKLAFSAPERRRSALLLACWVAGVLGVLGASNTFYLRYLLPAFPALAVFGGIALERLLAGRDHDRLRAGALAAFGAVLAAFIIFPIPTDGPGTQYRDLYRAAGAVLPADARMILYKDKGFRFNQGLAYYAGRTLDRQVTTPAEAGAALAGPGPAALIVTRNDFAEIDAAVSRGALKLKTAAASPNWRLMTGGK